MVFQYTSSPESLYGITYLEYFRIIVFFLNHIKKASCINPQEELGKFVIHTFCLVKLF